MAFVVDQQTNYKHYCRICRKGFGCGRALGGHMRAHGIGDESANLDDDDQQVSGWEDKLGGNVPPSNRRMYALRTNPNRLKGCRACENCGKEFFSWKSFLEHGKCSSSDSLVSSPGSNEEDDAVNGRRGCSGWSKRKRSLREKLDGHFNSNCPSSDQEEADLANILMMLSNGVANHNVNVMVDDEPEESCASASKDELERPNPMNFISPSYRSSPVDSKAKGVASKGLFECKACKKAFNSHQALGGHRASHKKVKGCFAARVDHHPIDDILADDEEFLTTNKSNSTLQHFDHASNAPMASTSKRKSKVHECSICHRVFSSGQALGGHKRCHWITSNAPDTSALARFQQFQEQLEQMNQVPKFDSESLELKLDLNLPASGDEVRGARRKNVTTEIYLQSWVEAKEADDDQGHSKKHHRPHSDDNNEDKNNKDSQTLLQNMDDEADSKVKLAKLSELKDMNLGSNSSPWLQVGLVSTVDIGTDT